MYQTYTRGVVQGAFPCFTSKYLPYLLDVFLLANNFVRHDFPQNHVRFVRWVLVQAVPFLFFIRTKAVIAATASLESKQCRERIRLVVLLTAPKIFAISLITDKNSCHNPARLSAWYF